MLDPYAQGFDLINGILASIKAIALIVLFHTLAPMKVLKRREMFQNNLLSLPWISIGIHSCKQICGIKLNCGSLNTRFCHNFEKKKESVNIRRTQKTD